MTIAMERVTVGARERQCISWGLRVFVFVLIACLLVQEMQEWGNIGHYPCS